MRFGEKCPQCGLVEIHNWRPRFISTETDVIEAENIPELTEKLKPRIPFTEGQWVYYKTQPRKHGMTVWVYRVLKTIFNANGGKFPDHRNYKLGNPSGRTAMMVAFNRNLSNREKQVKLA
jgi:hypothetical protein